MSIPEVPGALSDLASHMHGGQLLRAEVGREQAIAAYGPLLGGAANAVSTIMRHARYVRFMGSDSGSRLRVSDIAPNHRVVAGGVLMIDEHSRQMVDAHIEAANPPASLREAKGDQRSWTSWIAAYAEGGEGPSRREWRELLEWDLEAMIVRNKRDGHHLERYGVRYLAGMRSAVESGRLHPSLLDNCERTTPHIKRFYSDPLYGLLKASLGFAAVATPDAGVTIVDSGQKKHLWRAVAHEETHHVGNFRLKCCGKERLKL